MTRHLLVIGAQRSGTTFLHSLLDAHPQVALARPTRPEPKVFLSDEVLDRGREWYVRTFFPHASDEELLAEKSTSYIEDARAGVRASRLLGDVEALAVLRDPVARAVSNWRFSTDNGFENRPLELALRENLAGTRGWDATCTSVSPYAYLERGRYAHHLDAWDAVVERPVRVVLLQDLLGSRAAVQDLYLSLGLAPFEPPGRSSPVNASRQPKPDLPDDLVAELREYYRGSDDALVRRLQRELPWRTHDTMREWR